MNLSVCLSVLLIQFTLVISFMKDMFCWHFRPCLTRCTFTTSLMWSWITYSLWWALRCTVTRIASLNRTPSYLHSDASLRRWIAMWPWSFTHARYQAFFYDFWLINVLINSLQCFFSSESHAALYRNPGLGYRTLLFQLIQGDLCSACRHRQFHSLSAFNIVGLHC